MLSALSIASGPLSLPYIKRIIRIVYMSLASMCHPIHSRLMVVRRRFANEKRKAPSFLLSANYLIVQLYYTICRKHCQIQQFLRIFFVFYY